MKLPQFSYRFTYLTNENSSFHIFAYFRKIYKWHWNCYIVIVWSILLILFRHPKYVKQFFILVSQIFMIKNFLTVLLCFNIFFEILTQFYHRIHLWRHFLTCHVSIVCVNFWQQIRSLHPIYTCLTFGEAIPVKIWTNSELPFSSYIASNDSAFSTRRVPDTDYNKCI